MLTRRHFSKYILGVGSMLIASKNLEAFQPPLYQQTALDCDLLIKGGTVIDPSQLLHGHMDLAIKNGKIVQLSRDIPTNRAREVMSAKGKLVTPGLIKRHCHVFGGMIEGQPS